VLIPSEQRERGISPILSRNGVNPGRGISLRFSRLGELSATEGRGPHYALLRELGSNLAATFAATVTYG